MERGIDLFLRCFMPFMFVVDALIIVNDVRLGRWSWVFPVAIATWFAMSAWINLELSNMKIDELRRELIYRKGISNVD